MSPKTSWNAETAHSERIPVFRFVPTLCGVAAVFRFAAGARAQEYASVDLFGNNPVSGTPMSLTGLGQS